MKIVRWSLAALTFRLELLLLVNDVVEGALIRKGDCNRSYGVTASALRLTQAWQQAWQDENLNFSEHVPNRSYITMLTGDGASFVQGLQALGVSLRNTETKYPLVVLMTQTPAKSVRETLKCLKLPLIQIPSIANPDTGAGRYSTTYSKLVIWSLPSERVVWLDADTVVQQNIDDLFRRPAVPFAAGPDCGWACLRDSFNSGVMVVEPSHVVFTRMMSQLGALQSRDKGDQGFLNAFFNKWTLDTNAQLDIEYNVLKRLEPKPEFQATFRHAKVIHNVGMKPWVHSEDDKIYPKSHAAWRAAEDSISHSVEPEDDWRHSQ
eukprot:CAMPEP_0180609668 /NCGR_PEP_ID=MMETSP1037_2-20121125/28873_1 /TAXON_ID=632150 /ORGANISM="Azadinium spinosum, Strain 3D9" /LENGTH=319 /DNA_ID=CAMNT_0022629063 /DNA_START=39 /DNA_END=996 /DNA_ORIENTATION=-